MSSTIRIRFGGAISGGGVIFGGGAGWVAGGLAVCAPCRLCFCCAAGCIKSTKVPACGAALFTLAVSVCRFWGSDRTGFVDLFSMG